MSNANDVRRAHDLVDELDARAELSQEQEKLLRSFLPELPAQMTLEEIVHDVYGAWASTNGNEWPDHVHVELEIWLSELHAQLKGLKDAPATVPALPAGMRLADHEQYGRVVTSPKPNRDGVYDLLVSRPKFETGADWDYAHECELTFIDSEPAQLAHPEFLETEADYQSAPRGTVAAKDGWKAWLKETDGVWSCGGGSDEESSLAQTGKRRVLRWGWGE